MRGCRSITGLLPRGLAAIAVLAALGGCTSIGATRLEADRFDFSMKVRETNKEHLLLNIVAMRYGDAPSFLEVTSVISQYSREGSLRGDLPIDPPTGAADGGVGGSVTLRETPTVTYVPLSGDRFARSILTPIPPAALLAMIEAGWSADYLLRIAARSLNGISNGGHDPLFVQSFNPRFLEVIDAIGRLQRSGAMNLHVERAGEGYNFRARMAPDMSEESRRDFAAVARDLGLPGDGKSELAIRFGSVQTAPNELAIGSRSLFEILIEMSQGVELPADDRGGTAGPDPAPDDPNPPLLTVHSGQAKPADPHVAVRYRDHWFWIDGRDMNSKRMFLIAQILFSLSDTTSPGATPLVTIPTS